MLSAEYACKKGDETTTSKGLVGVASINSKEYKTQRTLDESYASERQKRIIFDEQLTKWNYFVRCKSAWHFCTYFFKTVTKPIIPLI